ncbi:uncharacterized protein GJ701_007630 [Geothlypis trichas]
MITEVPQTSTPTAALSAPCSAVCPPARGHGFPRAQSSASSPRRGQQRPTRATGRAGPSAPPFPGCSRLPPLRPGLAFPAGKRRPSLLPVPGRARSVPAPSGCSRAAAAGRAGGGAHRGRRLPGSRGSARLGAAAASRSGGHGGCRAAPRGVNTFCKQFIRNSGVKNNWQQLQVSPVPHEWRSPEHTCRAAASLSLSSAKGMSCYVAVSCEEKTEYKSLSEDPVLSWA